MQNWLKTGKAACTRNILTLVDIYTLLLLSACLRKARLIGLKRLEKDLLSYSSRRNLGNETNCFRRILIPQDARDRIMYGITFVNNLDHFK